MKQNRLPRTVEYAERAYRALEADGYLDAIAEQYPAQPKPAFEAKSPEVEQDWLKTATADEMKIYLEAKYRKG